MGFLAVQGDVDLALHGKLRLVFAPAKFEKGKRRIPVRLELQLGRPWFRGVDGTHEQLDLIVAADGQLAAAIEDAKGPRQLDAEMARLRRNAIAALEF